MVTIIAFDGNGKVFKGTETKVTEDYWKRLQKFGKSLRWKEVKTKIKEEENGRKKRSGTGNAVKKA